LSKLLQHITIHSNEPHHVNHQITALDTFEKAFDSTHLLHHLGKLGVLRQQLIDCGAGDAGAASHSRHSAWLA